MKPKTHHTACIGVGDSNTRWEPTEADLTVTKLNHKNKDNGQASGVVGPTTGE